jgi:hypothetical protein
MGLGKLPMSARGPPQVRYKPVDPTKSADAPIVCQIVVFCMDMHMHMYSHWHTGRSDAVCAAPRRGSHSGGILACIL